MNYTIKAHHYSQPIHIPYELQIKGRIKVLEEVDRLVKWHKDNPTVESHVTIKRHFPLCYEYMKITKEGINV